MPLRRVIEHMRDQNWTAVAIDFGIVVVGVFVAYYGAVLASVERTDSLLADPRSDPKELVVAAYRASELNYQPAPVATWNEIVPSGDIGLLPGDVARLAAEYFAFDSARDDYSHLSTSAYRRTARTVIPLTMQNAMRAGCSDARNEAQQIAGFMPDCVLDMAPEAIATTAAALRTDPAVRANLRHQYSEIFSTHANIGGDVLIIERALAALDGSPPPETAR